MNKFNSGDEVYCWYALDIVKATFIEDNLCKAEKNYSMIKVKGKLRCLMPKSCIYPSKQLAIEAMEKKLIAHKKDTIPR